MSLEAAILAYTKAQVISVNNRVYGVRAPNGVGTPYIRFITMTPEFVHSMGDDSGLVMSRIQFSVFGDEYGEVKGVIEDLKKAYRNYKESDPTVKMGGQHWVQATLLANQGDDRYEDATSLYHTPLDVFVWNMEVD